MKKITQILAVCMLMLFAWQTQAQTEIPQQNGTLTSGTDFVDGDIYTDSGGSAANYSSGEGSTLVMQALPSEVVTVTFTTFAVEASSGAGGQCWDTLAVTGDTGGFDATYAGDDNDAGAGLVCTDATDAAGNPTLGPFTSSVGGALTFAFNSDGSVTRPGWTADISVMSDPNAPIIVCPGDVMANNDAGMCSAVVNFSDAVAIDPNGGTVTVTQTMGPASGSTFPIGDTVIEFTATNDDAPNESVSCQFTITVVDNEPPSQFDCPDNIVVDNDPGVCGAMVDYPDPILMDNCVMGGGTNAGTYDMTINFTNPALMTVNTFSFTGAELGAITDATLTVSTFGDIDGAAGGGNDELWTITDEDGATTGTAGGTGDFADQCNTTVVEVFTIPMATIEAWAADGVIDFTGTDVAGNINLTLCGGDFLELQLTYDWEQNTAPPVPYTVIAGQASGTVFPVGTTTNTLEYTDAGGNVVTCSFDVTVNDVEAPVVNCIGSPATVTVTEDFDAGLPGTWSTVITSGTCDWQNGTDLPTGDDFTTPAMFFDDDACGNGAPASIVSLLSDVYDVSTSPVVTLGYDVAFQESGDQEFAVEVWDGAAWQQVALYADDLDPDIQTESIDVTAFANADFQVRWTFDDLTGAWGWHAGVDNFSLTYDVPAMGLDVILDANGMATIPASALVLGTTDNCGAVTISGAGGAPAPMTLATTLAGGNGNFGNMFDVNGLNDVVIQSFDIHGDTGATFDVEVYAKLGTHVGFEGDMAAWTLLGTAPGVVSNGDGVVTPLNLMLNYAIASGETHAFYVTPTDLSTGGFNYTTGTTPGAVFASDANLEFLEGSGVGYPFDSGTLFSPRVFNGAIQYQAGGAVGSDITFTCDDLGESLVEIFATDASGNESSCMATVNVIDDTAPVLVCADVTIELGPDGTTTIDPMELLANSPGSFEVMTISSDNQSGTEGFTDFTVPVTAAETVSFDWAYETMDGPDFDSFGYLLNGTYTELIDPLGANSQNGNSGAIVLAPGDVFGFRSQSDDGVFGPATTTVSNFLPGFTGQFDPANWVLTLTNSDGDAFFVTIPGGPLSFDACGITVLAVDVTEVTCDDIANSPITITVFASDASGNIAACTSQVTVVDALGPVVTCPADQTVDPGPGNLFYEVPDYFATGEATAVDNCTDPIVITSQDPAAGELIGDGVYTVNVCATDEYGNEECCTFELTVESVLGVDENALNNAISMYPNPAQSQVIIANSSNIALEKVMMYDVTGKLVNTVDLRGMQGEQVIDIEKLQTGMYMVQIQGEKASITKRLIKE